MAFLGKLLKKKPGGTLVGNLLRGVSNNLSGGILGQGAQRIELGQTQTNAQIAQAQAVAQGITPPATPASQIVGAIGAGIIGSDPGKAAIAASGVEWGKKYWWAILGGVALVFLAFKQLAGGKRRPYRR